MWLGLCAYVSGSARGTFQCSREKLVRWTFVLGCFGGGQNKNWSARSLGQDGAGAFAHVAAFVVFGNQ